MSQNLRLSYRLFNNLKIIVFFFKRSQKTSLFNIYRISIDFRFISRFNLCINSLMQSIIPCCHDSNIIKCQYFSSFLIKTANNRVQVCFRYYRNSQPTRDWSHKVCDKDLSDIYPVCRICINRRQDYKKLMIIVDGYWYKS